jgi:PAS domain-containing protein
LILAAIILFRIRQLSEINAERTKLLQDLKSANENFSGLFNFAPFGYLSVSKAGEIIEANNSAALILNTDKALLTNKKMSLFIADDSQSDFDKCISQLFLNAKKKSCEIQLKTNDAKSKHVYVEGWLLGFNDKCLITLVDITDRKLHEIELKKKTNELIHLNSFFVDRELKMVELKNEINELLIKLGNEKKYKV